MKKLTDSGASFDQLKAKLFEYLAEIGTPTEKAKAEKVFFLLFYELRLTSVTLELTSIRELKIVEIFLDC